MLRHGRWLFSVLGIVSITAIASACPFCPQAGQTLTQEVNQANLIVYGVLSNAKRDAIEFGNGTTDLTVEMIVKDHEFLKEKKVITLPRYVPGDPKNPMKYLVFCEVVNGKLDPYRGEAVSPDSKIAEYLKGAIAVREKDAPTRLRYFFTWLDAADSLIAMDAFMEFAAADYKDVAALAPKLDPKTIAAWLTDPNTPPSRYGFYGSLLGHCGQPAEHGPLLKKLLEDPNKKFSSGIDGMMAGYVMLAPQDGWEFIRKQLSDDKQEFLVRYAALRAVRFFWEYRRDLATPEQCVEALTLLLSQSDIADLPIDDLRRWGRWELTDRILGLYNQPTHKAPIVKRSIIRFALSAPKENASAAAFLKERIAEDPERVREIEQLLELEKAPEKVEATVEKKN
jgi:hypothetical protein